MRLDSAGRRMPGEFGKFLDDGQGFMMTGRGPSPCKNTPCGPDCIEGRGDEFDSSAHTANRDLKEFAETILRSIQNPEAGNVPEDSMRELGRLQYDAHFFTMPENVDLKALWSDWAPVAAIRRGTMAFLELEETATKAMQTAQSLDAVLNSRLSNRQHAAGCRCKTRPADDRYMYYAAKVGTKLKELIDKQLRSSGSLTRGQMIEACRVRYDNNKMTSKVFSSVSMQQGMWDQQHLVHDIAPSSEGTEAGNAALKQTSDMLRAEMTSLRPLIRGVEMLSRPGFRESSFKCKYIRKEWNNAHRHRPNVAQ